MSNLDTCCRRLADELDMSVFVVDLDPQLFGRPHTRGRLFFLCVRSALLAKAGLAYKDAEYIISHCLCVLIGHDPIRLDDVLLPEDHPIVRNHLCALEQSRASAVVDSSRALAKKRRRSETRSWLARHISHCQRRGLDWSAPSAFCDEGVRSCFPGLVELSERDIEV